MTDVPPPPPKGAYGVSSPVPASPGIAGGATADVAFYKSPTKEDLDQENSYDDDAIASSSGIKASELIRALHETQEVRQKTRTVADANGKEQGGEEGHDRGEGNSSSGDGSSGDGSSGDGSSGEEEEEEKGNREGNDLFAESSNQEDSVVLADDEELLDSDDSDVETTPITAPTPAKSKQRKNEELQKKHVEQKRNKRRKRKRRKYQQLDTALKLMLRSVPISILRNIDIDDQSTAVKWLDVGFKQAGDVLMKQGKWLVGVGGAGGVGGVGGGVVIGGVGGVGGDGDGDVGGGVGVGVGVVVVENEALIHALLPFLFVVVVQVW